MLMTTAVLAGVLGVCPTQAADQASTAARDRSRTEDSQSLDSRLDELIGELGSPQYTVRRAAANGIRKIGPEAFDQLYAATESSDPEIAASATYLLHQIAVRWTRSDDSVAVKRLMRSYGDREDADRQRIIQLLSAMPNSEGIPALCRVARFDRSPLLSRLAALSIVQVENRKGAIAASPSIDPTKIDRELGESSRVPVLWLKQFATQLQDPAASVDGWHALIDEEAKRLDVDVNETSPAIVSALLWNLSEVHRHLGQYPEMVQVADRYLTMGGNEAERLPDFMQWLVQNEAWGAFDEFSSQHSEEINQSKDTLYLLAIARSKQGQSDIAWSLARKAVELPPKGQFDSLESGRLLEELGQVEWAVREYQAGIDDQPIESVSAIGSRVMLSSLLQDYERYNEGAAALAPLVDAMEKNPDVARAFAAAQGDLAQQSHYIPEANSIAARMHYLQASRHNQDHEYSLEREELLKAIERDPADADVLIAMYRVEDADDPWMLDTRKRIQKLARKIEGEIEDNPNNPIPYNQWAWLVANTEGDFPKAVRFSRRSLELEPNTASFLDTLGRCYFSAGDYDKAVDSQRKAVALIPHMQVMQRQLREFEQKVAASEEKSDAAK